MCETHEMRATHEVCETHEMQEKKATLYELTADWLNLINQLEEAEGEINEEQMQLFDELISLTDDKFNKTLYVIKDLQNKADLCKEEADRLSKRRKSFERQANLLKDRLKDLMRAANIKSKKTDLFTVSLRKPAASISVVDADKLDIGYLIPQEPKIDKIAIFRDIRDGKTVEGVELKYGQPSLIIK